ncbi:MAG: STAS domain-containing protein [Sedimenticola sp.]|nr:STAS domain-containing protein [Sedimenticola sp.]
MAKATASMAGEGVLQLQGDLVFANVTALLGQIDPQLANKTALIIDMSNVADVDSSGLALLLELLERGQRRGVQLRFRALSEALLGIARLSNVEGLLPIEQADGA